MESFIQNKSSLNKGELMKTQFQLLLVALVSSSAAFAGAPEKLQITCQSADIGKIEVTLSEYNSFGSDEIYYYKITTKRFDSHTGKFLGSEEYPIDVHSNDARAILSTNAVVHLYPEQTLYLKVPAFGVDWQNFENKCYVEAPSLGFDLTFGLETNRTYDDHSKPYVRTYQTNPKVSWILVPGTPYARPQDVLNGKYCPDVDQWREAAQITCATTTP
jgi:hypothetical protein